MGIVVEDIARVRESSDMVAIVSQYTHIKKTGAQWMALCPFHGEKTPSMSVSAEKCVYYCFGCGVKGDVINFVQEIEHLDFAAAVELLAAKCGVTLRYDKANESAERSHRNKLFEALGEAVEFYHQRLLKAPDAGAARGYLRSRGFSPEEVRKYRLGWAPDDFDELSKALKVPDKIFVESGLGFINKRRRQQDSMSFRNRLLFPIFDERDRAVGFGGRILPGGEGAKYKNSNDNSVYSKSRVLYGLNWARESAVKAGEHGAGHRGQLVVCEGYTDVIGFARAGIPNAVATCGTSLTEDHVRLLKKFCSQVILAFDADKAGNAAAERFYQWEKDHDIDVAVADLPEGIDPGELAETDPERLRESIAAPTPFLAFRVARVLDAAPTTTPEERAKAAERAMSVIIEHPNPLVRDQYLQEVADRCRLDVERLRQMMASGAIKAPEVIDLRDQPVANAPTYDDDGFPADDYGYDDAGYNNAGYNDGGYDDPRDYSGGASYGGGRSGGGGGSGRSGQRGSGRGGSGRSGGSGGRKNSPQAEALRLAIQRPAEVAHLLTESLFSSEKAVIAFRVLAESETFHEAVEVADSETSELLMRLAVEETDAEPLDVVARLVDGLARDGVSELDVRARRGEDPMVLAEEMVMLKTAREGLYDPDHRADAVAALLQWASSRTEGGSD